mgnify:CR=1 FL=1
MTDIIRAGAAYCQQVGFIICTQLLAVYRRLCQINRQRIAERSFADNAVILYTAAKIFKGCYFRVTKKWKKSESIAFLQKDLKNGTEKNKVTIF